MIAEARDVGVWIACSVRRDATVYPDVHVLYHASEEALGMTEGVEFGVTRSHRLSEMVQPGKRRREISTDQCDDRKRRSRLAEETYCQSQLPVLRLYRRRHVLLPYLAWRSRGSYGRQNRWQVRAESDLLMFQSQE